MHAAKEKEDNEAACQILEIIKQEKERKYWWMNLLGKPRGGACFKVQVGNADGTVEEFTGQEDLEKAIWDNIHRKRFILAEDMPLCMGALQGNFGYNVVLLATKSVLAGTYMYPESFDKATKEILQECAWIRPIIPKDSVNTTVTQDNWEAHWWHAKEGTSSSVSRRHFGHYKAGLISPFISYLQSLCTTLVVKKRMVLDRWGKGLSVMLEKIFECLLITKLRSIFLMETDFNSTNKRIFGIKMMENVQRYNLMPEEVFSKRNRLAEDGTLSKILFYDMVRQLCHPAGLALVDVDNCYDRIAHPMASMVFQAFGVPNQQ